MGIYIPGMEMPTSCFYCPFREKINPDDYVCLALNREFEETFSLIAGKRHKACPLVPVPKHGGLIDKKTVSENLAKVLNDKNPPFSYPDWNDAIVAMLTAPTIIPASPKEEELFLTKL